MSLTPKPLVLASLYMPIEQQIPPKDLTDLITHCEENDKDLTISVDINAHLWGSTTTNKRGEQLVFYQLTTNLTILNKGTEPTFMSSRYQTFIDCRPKAKVSLTTETKFRDMIENARKYKKTMSFDN
ncbi:jg27747 [Pararge aegeria aegeria]|uniref:Jg27747 protein n=1 Tax=Pararge aegeria aegeria TaxID=348720 RepID=A0A8S4QXQ5_9NEOP|nr:jg27747 [Pararge aegeria aegeria]